MRFLVQRFPQGIDLPSSDGRTPLSMASTNSDHRAADIAHALLDTGLVDVESVSGTGRTPVSYAIASGRLQLSRVLILKGKADWRKVISFSNGEPSFTWNRFSSAKTCSQRYCSSYLLCISNRRSGTGAMSSPPTLRSSFGQGSFTQG